MLFFLIIIGSAIFVSSAILHVRKRAFEKKFAELAERRQERLRRRHNSSFGSSRQRPSASQQHENLAQTGPTSSDVIQPIAERKDHEASFSSSTHNRNISDATLHMTRLGSKTEEIGPVNEARVHFKDSLSSFGYAEPRQRNLGRHHGGFFEGRGVGAHGLENHPRHTRPTDHDISMDGSAIVDLDDVQFYEPPSGLEKYVHTINGYLGRNSQFHHLTAEERRKLGGIEYDAICLLSWVVPLYFVLWQLLGALGVGAWIQVNRPGMTLQNGETTSFSSIIPWLRLR